MLSRFLLVSTFLFLLFIMCPQNAEANSCTGGIDVTTRGLLEAPIVPAGGGTFHLTIIAPPDCGWTVTINATWIQFASPSSGFGNGSVVLVFAPNSGGFRSAFPLINGFPFPIPQLGVPGLAAPTNLQVSQLGTVGDQVKLTWDYGSDRIDGFSIESKTPSGNWVPLTNIASQQARSFLDTTVPSFFTISYRIRAYQGNTYSDYSGIKTAYQLNKAIIDNGTAIQALFTPDPTVTSIQDSAHLLGYHHFNWISVINHDPPCYTNNPSLHAYDQSALGLFPRVGSVQLAPHLDPPLGGYVEYGLYPGNLGPMDELPYLWNEKQQWYLDPGYSLNPGFDLAIHSPNDTLTFRDRPMMPCLLGSGPAQPSDYWGFFTMLVGIETPIGGQPPKYTPLASFAWNTTYNGVGGGISPIRTINLEPAMIEGTGGIFNVTNVSLEDLPLDIRTLLIQTGAQGITTSPKADKDAPVTAIFLSGKQGTSDWYTGPVNVTLVATDIDGPLDIAATSYSIDGGAPINYTGPFTISVNGIHTIQFGSVDGVGNVESPRPTQTIKIDQTPPVISAAADPSMLWPPNGKMAAVTVSGNITDALSGVNNNTASFAVIDEYGQVQPAGGLVLRANKGYSFSIHLPALRNGDDRDGRQYTIMVMAKDKAGNLGSTSIVVTVPHDQGR